ncbi:MAG TPA: TetR/AcrR family transcriptional regulator [Rhizomicrobium sp.]|nr:TetR/AcrR family transcriptional regulator [Rhizomicrobium sp.]
MPAKPKHRDAIVNAAVALFRRHGYSGTGLSDIVERSGAPKGSLYHYFPNGKLSIAEAAVRTAAHRVDTTFRELAERHKSPGKLVRAYAELLAGWMKASGFRDGSPIATVLLETAPDDAAITQAGREAYAERNAVLYERLAAKGVPLNRAKRLAGLVTAAMEGSLIQSRVDQSEDPIRDAAAELEKLLDAVVAEYAKG